MAFTFAHPAIFMRTVGREVKYLSCAALVLGSMAPDFEYFILLQPMRTIGHQLTGFVLLNLPLVFLLYIIWHYVVKNTLLTHSPDFIGRRLSLLYESEFFIKSWKTGFVFAYSAVIGMASHVVWDSFTHDTGFFVERIGLLRIEFLHIFIYKYLQHGSTLVGFMVILYCINKLERRALPTVPIAKKIRLFVSISLLYGLFLYIMLQIISRIGIGSMIIMMINALLLATLVAIGIVNIFKKAYNP